MVKDGMSFHKPAVALTTAIWVFLVREGSTFAVTHGLASSFRSLDESSWSWPHEAEAHLLRLQSSTSQDHERSLHEIGDRHHQKALFKELCEKAEILPSNSVYLDAFTSDDGSVIRGVYLSRSVTTGDTIFSVPLSVCLRDDEPPQWYDCDSGSDPEGGDEHNPMNPCLIAGYYNPRDWATRLAASVVDLKLEEAAAEPATKLWLSLLPDPNYLRATLPIHWPTPILQSACCAALELQVDAAFFARAQASQDLLAALSRHPKARHWDPERLRRLCDDALDVVQTRSCRVAAPPQPEDELLSGASPPWAPPLRLLAPVFDFLNHPSRGRPNAEFFLDAPTERLVVRALRDVSAYEEVLIHYGDCTRPASKCLGSYGFVPSFEPPDSDGEREEDSDDIDQGDAPQHVAEVYIDGIRYEVGPETIPEDIVVAMSAEQLEDVTLTPEIAIRLASRVSDVAYHLLLDPRNRSADDEVLETPEEVVSAKLAASLRWNQHRVLLACALGLRDWAVDVAPETIPHS